MPDVSVDSPHARRRYLTPKEIEDGNSTGRYGPARIYSGNLRRDGDGYYYTERECVQRDHEGERWLPATRDHFTWLSASGRWHSWCRECARRVARDYRLAHPGQRRTRPTGRRYGVEIEFLGDQGEVARALRAAGVPCRVEGYNHNVSRSTWKVVDDGSVCGGGELVSPILRGASGRAALERVGRALATTSAKVDRSTGLHVHHEVTNLRVSAFRRLIRNWARCQEAVDGLVASSRRRSRNTYCRQVPNFWATNALEFLTTMDRSRFPSQLTDDRYYTLNLCSYPKYGTVEIRQHQGTLDAAKILAWVEFGQAMVRAAVDGTELATTVTGDLLAALPFEREETRDYLRRRAAELADREAAAVARRRERERQERERERRERERERAPWTTTASTELIDLLRNNQHLYRSAR